MKKQGRRAFWERFRERENLSNIWESHQQVACVLHVTVKVILFSLISLSYLIFFYFTPTQSHYLLHLCTCAWKCFFVSVVIWELFFHDRGRDIETTFNVMRFPQFLSLRTLHISSLSLHSVDVMKYNIMVGLWYNGIGILLQHFMTQYSFNLRPFHGWWNSFLYEWILLEKKEE